MYISLTPSPHEKWSPLPRPGLGRRPPERLRGLTGHVLTALAKDGHIVIIELSRPGSTRPIRLVSLESLDIYLDKLAAKREFWKGVAVARP
jgi:hypothetical protein